jgi:nucleotide-binding universal stress UspA family protein
MRILLAIDGSEPSEAAVDEITRQHFPADSEVRVIAVVEPAYLGKGLDMSFYDVEAEKAAREQARAAVEKAATKLRADEGSRQFNVTTEVFSGSPKGVILEEAEAFGADLIVVGSHGHGMLERFRLGSVSNAVALHAKCSVEIVRKPEVEREARRILLAIDGSEQSEAAVDEIAHRHFPPGSEVRVISVIAAYLPGTYAPWDGMKINLHDQMGKDAREVARTAVEKAAAKLRAHEGNRNLTITTEVLSGSPKGVILQEAEAFGADLIVVGSHGHGVLERFLLGSISQAVALHAKRSVEIVRSPKSGEK